MSKKYPTNKMSTARLMAVAVVVFMALPLVMSAGALPLGTAQAEEQKKPPEKTRKTQAISAKVYEKLAKAQEAAEAKQYSQAASILDGMIKSGKLKGYDAASVWNVYGFIHYSRERYRDAIKAYKKVVSFKDIPEALEVGTKYTLAQLNFVVEDYPGAIRAMKDWFKVANNPGPDPYVLLGQAYYQTKDYDSALRNVEKGLSEARRREIAPKEHWYLLLRVLYYEKNNYKKTASVLEELIRRWPKREYWVQLAGMYGELKQEKKQLIAMETAYQNNMLQREGELMNMAYLYLGNDMPYKAGKVIDKAIKEDKIKGSSRNYETMGNAWYQAQEIKKAIPALESAAKTSDKGEIFARLAGVYLDNEEFAKSIAAANRALAKGGVKRRDTVYMVKGMAQFNSNKLNAALASFDACAKDKRSKKACGQWKSYVAKDQHRRQQLAEDLKALENAKNARKSLSEQAG